MIIHSPKHYGRFQTHLNVRKIRFMDFAIMLQEHCAKAKDLRQVAVEVTSWFSYAK
jgi:hypothetical protein